ncbi:MAG: NUDIX hydrolase [Chromatiales bacterium]|nr:NUDIX hydrolase [Chromatiales bacterium]
MVWSPHVTVAAVIERDQHFLMVEERPAGVSVFNQPAGHLEAGETLLDAVVRETLEETAHVFTPTALVGIYRWQNETGEATYLRFCFTGHCAPTPLDRALDADILACHWLGLAELARRNLRSPLVNRAIDDYMRGLRYPLDILHEVL